MSKKEINITIKEEEIRAAFNVLRSTGYNIKLEDVDTDEIENFLGTFIPARADFMANLCAVIETMIEMGRIEVGIKDSAEETYNREAESSLGEILKRMMEDERDEQD